MPKISILGTATPPPYCDCVMDEPKPHYHWAIFVDPTGAKKQLSWLPLFCLSQDYDDDFSDAAVFDLHGRRLRRRLAIQVSFTAKELPVQIVVAKPGSPQSKIWAKRHSLVNSVEKALEPLEGHNTSQDDWVDAVIIALIEAGLLERFNQDSFRSYARQQLGPPGDFQKSDIVKEVDYVEARKAESDKPVPKFVRGES